MKEKDLVEKITKKKSAYSEHAEDLANTLETVSDDMYTESDRFIYELMQNADDACNEEEERLETVIEFTNNFIVISHNGKAFNQKDVEAISSTGKSQKSENPNQTGYKGIGFKSVFAKSNRAYISSGNYCFRYDKDYWQKRCSWKVPWQIIPIWSAEEIPPELKRTRFRKYPVSTAIRFDKDKEVNNLKSAVNKLFSNSQIMLFLRNVTEVRIVHSGREDIFRKTKQVINKRLTEVHLESNRSISKWIVGGFSGIELDDDIKDALRQAEKVPERLKQAQYTNISFAGRINDENQLTAIKESSLIFTYLPTKIKKSFPFLVNADFLTNAPREGFHEDRDWNIWLFEQVARKTFEWLQELASTDEYRYQVTELIPDRFKASLNPMNEAFNEGYDQAIEQVAFIPNREDNLLLASDSLIEGTDIDRVIGLNTLIDYYNSKNGTNFSSESIVNKKLKSLSDLKRKLGVKTFGVQDLKNFLSSPHLRAQGSLEITDGVNIIKFFHQKATDKNKKNSDFWRKYITEIPFILNQENQLCTPSKPIYLPVDNLEIFEINELNRSFDFIHNQVFKKIHNSQIIWLSEIGIVEPTPNSVIEKTISPNLKNLTNSTDKCIEIARYLFKHRKSISDYSMLSELQVLTNQGRLRSANSCYLSDFYEPKVALEEYLDEDIFVSHKYRAEDENIKEWNLFWTEIGVREKLEWSKGILEKCVGNTKFAKLLWNNAFQEKLPKLRQNEKGQYYYWFKKLSIFPCVNGETKKAGEVIINRPDFKKIGGNALPIIDLDLDLDLDIRYSNIITSLGFRTTIGLSEYLLVLSKISKVDKLNNSDNNSETTERIGLIYKELSRFTEAHGEINQWGRTNKILSTCNEFVCCNELYYLNVDHIKEVSELKKYVKVSSSMRNDRKLVNLFHSLGVKVIDQKDLGIEKIGSDKDSELQMCLIEKMPLIALIAAKDTNSYSELLAELRAKIDKASFFKCDELYLHCSIDGDLIFQKEKSALAEGNEFYYTRQWYSTLTLYDLTPELCYFLNIKDISKELNAILPAHFQEGLDWLENRGYDISQVPEQASVSETDRDYTDTRSPTQREESQRIGEIAEKLIFDELIEAYKRKYSHENIIVESTSEFQTESAKIVWHRAKGDLYEDKDMTITENSVTKYIEVKATKPTDYNLYLSFNEWTLMKESQDHCYFVARVFNANEPSEITFIEMNKVEIDSL